MVFDIEERAEDIVPVLLLVAEGCSADEVPEIDLLGTVALLVDAIFSWLELCVAVLERDAVFAIRAGPSVLHPAGVRCVGAGPAVGGFAGAPVSDVEADEGVAFFEHAENGVVEVEEVGDAGTGLGGLRHIHVFDLPAGEFTRDDVCQRFVQCRFRWRDKGEIRTQAEGGEEDGNAENENDFFHEGLEGWRHRNGFCYRLKKTDCC